MALTAILLSAGYATRLYPLTKDVPKALLPLGERVILDEVYEAIREVPGVSKCLLVTNHRFAGHFEAWRRRRGATLQVIDDGTDTPETRLGAIRDLELARTRGEAEGDLLVVGTDNLFTWPLADFVRAAQRRRPAPSLALWEAPSAADAVQFGVVELDGTGRVTAFVEKSPEPPSPLVALCLYYFPAAMLPQIQQFIDSGGNTDAPGHFLKWLAERGAVFGVRMSGAWYDIGTRESYDEVVRAWPAARAR